MTLTERNDVWKISRRPADLVLVTDSPSTGLWEKADSSVLRQVRERLPGVRVTSASPGSQRGLRGALAAAWFLGASEIVVVRLWNGETRSEFELRHEMSKQGVRITLCDSPAEADAVVAAYQTAGLADLPSSGTVYPRPSFGPLSSWAA